MRVKFLYFNLIFLLAIEISRAQSIPLESPPLELIQTSIANFSKGGKLYKKDSVFVIWVRRLTNNEDLLVVSIGKTPTKILFTSETVPGSKGKAPSRYVENNGKLFFWWDNNHPLTNEALAIFGKFNLLEDDQNGILKVPSARIDDSQKAAHYYFCKGNSKRFKRVVTNIATGYYDPPKLKCNNPHFAN